MISFSAKDSLAGFCGYLIPTATNSPDQLFVTPGGIAIL
jgi:hypothetical protein